MAIDATRASGFLESQQKQLWRRNIGKVFSSRAANIPPTLTMPTDAG
jgi:hypothetical protein